MHLGCIQPANTALQQRSGLLHRMILSAARHGHGETHTWDICRMHSAAWLQTPPAPPPSRQAPRWQRRSPADASACAASPHPLRQLPHASFAAARRCRALPRPVTLAPAWSGRVTTAGRCNRIGYIPATRLRLLAWRSFTVPTAAGSSATA